VTCFIRKEQMQRNAIFTQALLSLSELFKRVTKPLIVVDTFVCPNLISVFRFNVQLNSV